MSTLYINSHYEFEFCSCRSTNFKNEGADLQGAIVYVILRRSSNICLSIFLTVFVQKYQSKIKVYPHFEADFQQSFHILPELHQKQNLRPLT